MRNDYGYLADVVSWCKGYILAINFAEDNISTNFHLTCDFSVKKEGLYWIVVGSQAANAQRCTAAEGLLYKPWPLVVPTCTAIVVKGGTTWARNGR